MTCKAGSTNPESQSCWTRNTNSVPVNIQSAWLTERPPTQAALFSLCLSLNDINRRTSSKKPLLSTVCATLYYEKNKICNVQPYPPRVHVYVRTPQTFTITTSWFINQYRFFYVQIHQVSHLMEDLTTAKWHKSSSRWEGRRTWRYWDQSPSSASSAPPSFCWFLRLWSSSSSILTNGFTSPWSRASAWLCLFPKRPIGLTPRPTYQNGSISGPGRAKKAFFRQ